MKQPNSFLRTNRNFFDELYLVGKDDLMTFISNREEAKEILIIGHNFGISELASYYTGKQILLKTGGFVSIDFPDTYK